MDVIELKERERESIVYWIVLFGCEVLNLCVVNIDDGEDYFI